MDVLRAVIDRLSVDIHHVIEAAGIVVLGLVFYSYARRWFDSNRWIDARLRALAVGVVFGVLTIALMISRIEVGQGTFVDARALPIALITLVEGRGAGLVAALVAAAYRASLGGAGAPAGVAGLLATAGAATLALQWARRSGGVRSRHGFVLGAAVYVITLGSFFMLGARGLELFKRDWLPLLIVSVIGVGGFTRLFLDVVNAQAAEAARRDAAELRAVTLLARAAAHEINNALMVVAGGLAILARRLPAESEDLQWAERARDGVNKVKDIVLRMNTITQIEEVPGRGLLAPMLDIRRSSRSD
ncbi:MAG TPA: LytS/YhcK type 5TM receptor domain-containing protein [Methylomirabilota bacterium]|nr:LytS/YhcK type 5TM receptor domain-containing protein [Methylomirabilota bacterium]